LTRACLALHKTSRILAATLVEQEKLYPHELEQPRVTADNTFTYSSVAGEQDEFMPEYQMVVSGNYLLGVQHGTDIVELTFAYEAIGNMTEETPAAPPPSPAQEEPQQQQQQPSPLSQQLQSPQQPEVGQQENQGGGTGVSIVPGASTLTTDAFQPNPIQVSVGSTVTWTNDDSQPHTATSGQDATPDGRFDSSIMAPGATFEHTFTEAGEYPYFCLLHPNQVGTVTVTAAGAGSESTSIGSNPTTAPSMGDAAAGGSLSELTEPFQDLFGSGD
jgi:plastocyanin